MVKGKIGKTSKSLQILWNWLQIGIKQSVSKNMDLVNAVNGGTYDERNISGLCKLCKSKFCSFVLCLLILCSTIYNKILEKYGLKSSLRSYPAKSLKINFFVFVVSIDKWVTICTIQARRRYIYNKFNFNSYEFCCIGQSIFSEGKWHYLGRCNYFDL